MTTLSIFFRPLFDQNGISDPNAALGWMIIILGITAIVLIALTSSIINDWTPNVHNYIFNRKTKNKNYEN